MAILNSYVKLPEGIHIILPTILWIITIHDGKSVQNQNKGRREGFEPCSSDLQLSKKSRKWKHYVLFLFMLYHAVFQVFVGSVCILGGCCYTIFGSEHIKCRVPDDTPPFWPVLHQQSSRKQSNWATTIIFSRFRTSLGVTFSRPPTSWSFWSCSVLQLWDDHRSRWGWPHDGFNHYDDQYYDDYGWCWILLVDYYYYGWINIICWLWFLLWWWFQALCDESSNIMMVILTISDVDDDIWCDFNNQIPLWWWFQPLVINIMMWWILW